MAKKSAVQRRPRFNPTEYREDFKDLIATNPELAAKSASQLAGRKVRAENAVAEADNATRELLGGLTSVAVMSVGGWWLGNLEAKQMALIDDWEAEGADMQNVSVADVKHPWDHENGVKNPMKWWFFPKVLVLPLSTGVLALISASMRKGNQMPSTFERAMTLSAVSTLGLSVASMLGSVSYERKAKKIQAKGGLNSVKGGEQPAVPAAA